MSCAWTWSMIWSMASTRTAAAQDVRAKADIDIAVLPFVKLARLLPRVAGCSGDCAPIRPRATSVQHSLVARAVCLQTLPFHELPGEQAGHAENEIGHALDQ